VTALKNKQIKWVDPVNLNDQSVSGLGEPVDNTSPVRRQDVGENWKRAVLVATIDDANWTSAVTLAFAAPTLTISGLAAGATYGLIDGVEPTDDDRVLIKDATTAATGGDTALNGIWKVTGGTTTSLTLERAEDADTAAKLSVATVGAYKGTQVSGLFKQTAEIVTLNIDPVTFESVSGDSALTVPVGWTAAVEDRGGAGVWFTAGDGVTTYEVEMTPPPGIGAGDYTVDFEDF
jgi:hypothetical protein